MVASRKMPADRNTQQIHGWMQRFFLFLSCCSASQGASGVLHQLDAVAGTTQDVGAV